MGAAGVGDDVGRVDKVGKGPCGRRGRTRGPAHAWAANPHCHFLLLTPTLSSLPPNYKHTHAQMAGKSTILRCAASVALLASCGLHAPAKAARVRRFDSIVLRAFASDAPAHGRSSFAVEMDEMRAVLAGASARSLILVDELGKGTEAAAGAALAGAMLEALAARGCTGVFATHLHALLDLPLGGAGGDGLARLRMLTRVGNGGVREPAWKVVAGSSTESLALEVAAGAGVPEAVVTRAAELFEMVVGVGARATPPVPAWAVAASAATPPPPTPAPAGGALARTAVVAAGCVFEADAADQAPAWCPSASPPPPFAPPSAPPPPPAALLTAASLLASTAEALLGDRPTPIFIPPHCDPPANVAAAVSCVYVLCRPDGWCYCGETDALADRLRAHRTAPPVRGGPAMSCVYVRVPGGKTAARAVEAAVIRELVRGGVGMLSVVDGVSGRGVGVGVGVGRAAVG